MVDWRWDHDPVGADYQHDSPGPSSLEFTYTPPGHSRGRALFPEEQAIYRVEAEIDNEGRTIWFALPAGKCVHSLAEELDSPIYDWTLRKFTRDWLFARTPDTCEFSVDFGQSDSTDQGFEVVFNDEDALDDEYKSMHLRIPKELLQDPIANGSEDFAYGFNPWNEGQKVEIIAYLDPHLPRLFSFFETTADSDRENQRFVSGEWEDGLMPFIPAAASLC